MRLIFLILFSFFLWQCGLPNPYNSSDLINPPHSVKTFSSNNTIHILADSFNIKEARQNIYGYNLYFSYVSNTNEITNNLILIDSSTNEPSISYNPTSNHYTVEFILSNSFRFLDISNSNTVSSTNISPFTSYYFIISPVSGSSTKRHLVISKETTEKNLMDYSIPINTYFVENNANFYFSPDFIIPASNYLIQDMGYYDDSNDIKYAPTNGYLSTPVILKKKHIYIYKTPSGNFGKIFIKNISPTQVTIDFSYQGKLNELEV